MRFIHTADWHLGNRMHEIDRTDEAASFLSWLKEEIVRREADCLVVAGDIYDVANPPNEAKKLYCSFLASLIGTCCRNVIIVGGNHDSGSLLDTEKEILAALNIHVTGSLSGRSPEELVFELVGASGNAVGIAAAVPYARETELMSFVSSAGDSENPKDAGQPDGVNADSGKTDGVDAGEPDGEAEEADGGHLADDAYGALYRKVWEAADRKRAGRKIPVIATGHLYAAELEGRFAGCRDTGSFDDGTRAVDILGNLGLVSPSVFPDGFDYVALGHVHYSTMVAKNPKIRYSGSPFVMGFDEADIPHQILCVDCVDGKSSVEKIAVPAFARFRRLSGSITEIRKKLEAVAACGRQAFRETDRACINSSDSAGEAVASCTVADSAGKDAGEPSATPCYLELCYSRDAGDPSLDTLDELIERLPRNVRVVSWKRKMALEERGQETELDSRELRSLGEDEIFTSLIQKRASEMGVTEQMKQEMLGKFLPLFMQLADEVRAGEEER
ncbi:MAG: exonuclease subunit SbcD [Treponema sp.]|nr:exonuclease subunit SbcD [Treponema sp.]